MFGAILTTSPHLVGVPSVTGKDARLHTLAADGFCRLAVAAGQALGISVEALGSVPASTGTPP